MKKNQKLVNLILKIVGIILVIFFLFAILIFSLNIFKLRVLPVKYVVGFYLLVFVIILTIVYLFINKKSLVLKIALFTILTLLSLGLLYVSTYFSSTHKFIEDIQDDKESSLSFSVVVLNNSGYEKLEDLKNKKFAYMLDNYAVSIKEKLNLDYEEKLQTALYRVSDALLKGEVDAIVLEESYFILAKEEMDGFEENIKVIYTFEIPVSKEETSDSINITLKPFVLYISGIDRYGKIKTLRGRSDVNQLVVVNPNTNKVLLVNTPRDYYVQLHGTTGLKDKLTHAGIYGIDKSKNTLGDLYNINIDYYLRVGFDTLINIVDVIGGLDIYSDKAFKSYTIGSVYIKEGWNHLNGLETLAFARERYAYSTGDRHRGENQQQVISAIIEKITSKDVLLKNYNNILNTLSSTFQTNMSIDMITSFIRMQLDKMSKWEVEMISVTGSDSRSYTYSMGNNHLLYVMEPDMNSVNVAKNKIKEVLNEN